MRRAAASDARGRALAWLQAHSSPRLLMFFMLASTMGSGFLASFTLFHAGLHSPVVRYPLCVLIAWIVFLLLVSIWVWWHRRGHRRQLETATRASAKSDRSGPSIDVPIGGSGGTGGTGGVWSGGGGRYGGGGASDSFADAPVRGFTSGLSSGSKSGGGGWDFDFGGDDLGAVVLLIVAAVVAAVVLGFAIYAVYSAPTFFAELLIDGGVGTWLYKRADVAHRADWLSTAMRRSVAPMLVALVLFTGLALVMQGVAPGAATLGQAWQHATTSKP